jgi:hypothetical protein
MPKFLLSLDLQTFADDVIIGGYNPEPREPVENPLLTDEPVEPVEAVEPVEQEQPVEESPEFDFGGRKVKPNDIDAIKGVHEDWQNSQRYIQQLQQERAQMLQMQQQFMQQQQPQAQEPQEDIEQINEQLMERFYENPKALFDEMKQAAIEAAKKEFEPIQKANRYQSEIQEVSSKHQDFGQFVPQMQEIIQSIGEERAEQLGLENVYYMARGRAPQPNPQDMFNDVNFVKQQVMNNEQIRNELLKEFMNNKQQRQPQVPVMGNNQGGQTPYAGQVRPKSISEATRLAQQYFNGQ